MIIELDWEHLKQKEEAQEYLAERFGMPDYYGKNLDALYDCLSERGESVTIWIQGMDAADKEGGAGYAEKILRVLRDLEREYPEQIQIGISISADESNLKTEKAEQYLREQTGRIFV